MAYAQLYAYLSRERVFVGDLLSLIAGEHTIELAKQLDQLQRRGINAELVLDLAAARKPLPIDHPTAALAYRVRELVAPKKRRPQTIDPFPRSPQRETDRGLGL